MKAYERRAQVAGRSTKSLSWFSCWGLALRGRNSVGKTRGTRFGIHPKRDLSKGYKMRRLLSQLQKRGFTSGVEAVHVAVLEGRRCELRVEERVGVRDSGDGNSRRLGVSLLSEESSSRSRWIFAHERTPSPEQSYPPPSSIHCKSFHWELMISPHCAASRSENLRHWERRTREVGSCRGLACMPYPLLLLLCPPSTRRLHWQRGGELEAQQLATGRPACHEAEPISVSWQGVS